MAGKPVLEVPKKLPPSCLFVQGIAVSPVLIDTYFGERKDGIAQCRKGNIRFLIPNCFSAYSDPQLIPGGSGNREIISLERLDFSLMRRHFAAPCGANGVPRAPPALLNYRNCRLKSKSRVDIITLLQMIYSLTSNQLNNGKRKTKKKKKTNQHRDNTC